MSSGHKAIPSSLPLCGISFLNINSLSLAVTGLSHCDSFTLSSLACPLSVMSGKGIILPLSCEDSHRQRSGTSSLGITLKAGETSLHLE